MAWVIDGIKVGLHLRDTETNEVREVHELKTGASWPKGIAVEPGRANDESAEAKPPRKKAKQSKSAPKATKAKKTPKEKPKRAKPKKPPVERDLADLHEFDQAVLAAVQGGAKTVAALARLDEIEGDRVQVLAALARLVESGELEQVGTGRRARYERPGLRTSVVGKYTVQSDPMEASLDWDDNHLELYLIAFVEPDDESARVLEAEGIPLEDIPALLEVLQTHAHELQAVSPPDEDAQHFQPPPEPEPEPLNVEVVEPPPAKLRWVKQSIKNRETHAAMWDRGTFRIVVLTRGAHALYYEPDQGEVLDYGCAPAGDEGLKALKKLARELAEAGLPTPAVYRAAGGDLSACPAPRRLRLGDSELTWHDTIDSRQLCVAAAGDGEFKLLHSDGGSFILAFARAGDAAFESLGCGTRETLELRALDLLEQISNDDPSPPPSTPKGSTKQKKTVPRSEPKSAPEPTNEPANEPAPTPEPANDPAKDKAVMDALTDILKNLP
jgi:uncharacterized membrane protein